MDHFSIDLTTSPTDLKFLRRMLNGVEMRDAQMIYRWSFLQIIGYGHGSVVVTEDLSP
jgi:hypothetical protein